jgi:flagella basal body P-ring formation protein FlgA
MKYQQHIFHTSRSLFTVIVCLLTFFIVSQMSGNPFAAGINTIKVFKRAEIKGDKVRLGRISTIRGEDSELINKLRAIVISKAPLPGKSRRIDEDYIKIRLKQNGIDLSQIRLLVPGKVEVYRGVIEIPKEKIKKVILDFVYGMVPRDKERARVKKVHVSSNVVLPEGKVTYSVVPPKNMDFLGTIPLSVLFKVNGNFQKKVWATVNIEVLTEMVVTKRPLRRHQLITEDDIQLKEMDLAEVKSNSVTNYEEVLGKRTKRAIKANEVLRTDHIELPPLVRRGDVVSIIAESDGLMITALGEVRKRGCRGERIRVVNLDSKKGIYGRVLDANTVKVDF